MTRPLLEPLRTVVQADVDAHGLRPAASNRNLALSVVRGALECRNLTADSLMQIAAAYDLELYIGPPRSSGPPAALGPALRDALGLDAAATEADAVAAVRRMPASGEAALRDLWLCRRARERLSSELSRQLGVNRALLDALNETSADRARQLGDLVAMPGSGEARPDALAEAETPYEYGPPHPEDGKE